MNGGVVGKDQPAVVKVCPKHGPIVVAGPGARLPGDLLQGPGGEWGGAPGERGAGAAGGWAGAPPGGEGGAGGVGGLRAPGEREAGFNKEEAGPTCIRPGSATRPGSTGPGSMGTGPTIRGKPRPISVTVSPIQGKKEDTSTQTQEGKMAPAALQTLNQLDLGPRRPTKRSALSSSTYRAFASVDDPIGISSQEHSSAPGGEDRNPEVPDVGFAPLERGRHCVPRRPISDDLSAPCWVRRPVAVAGSVSAPGSPVNSVRLQRVSPQRARLLPGEGGAAARGLPSAPPPPGPLPSAPLGPFPAEPQLQQPVPVRQARRMADPHPPKGSDGLSMRTDSDAGTGTGSDSLGRRSDDPWIKGPEPKPVAMVPSEIVAMETNLDGYVAQKLPRRSWNP